MSRPHGTLDAVARANVVVSAYATTEWMLGSGLRLFNENTVLVEVPFQLQGDEKLADKAFGRTVERLKDWTDKSVLRRLFQQQIPGIEPASIALITFSAGTTFAKAVLGGVDREYLDSLIVLDGLHIPRKWDGTPHDTVLDPFVWFGERAAFDERLMVVAETDIVPYNNNVITSTSESGELVMSGVQTNIASGAQIKQPSYMSFGDAAKSGAIEWESIGNLWRLEYGGGQASDHIRVAKSASQNIWKTFLVPRWNAGVTCRGPDIAVSGFGSAECVPNRVVVPEGLYEPSVLRNYVLPGAVGAFVVGSTYWLGTKIARMI